MIELLNENFVYGKIISHRFFLSPTKHLSQVSQIVIYSFCLVIMLWMMWWIELQIYLQLLPKCTPEIPNKFGILIWNYTLWQTCSLTTSLKNNSATWTTSLVFLQGIKCVIFENLSTTTKIESCMCYVLGNPRTKSMLTSSHDFFGIGNGWYNPISTSLLSPFDILNNFVQTLSHLAVTVASNNF